MPGNGNANSKGQTIARGGSRQTSRGGGSGRGRGRGGHHGQGAARPYITLEEREKQVL